MITLPIFLILALMLGDNFKAPDSIFTWLLAVMSFLLSFVLTFFLTASLGLITIWQNQPEGFFALFGFASNTLGGVVVPLALMPGGVGDILQWLPFAYIYSLPVKIFQGLPGDQLVQGFAVQLLWVAVSALFFRWVWRKATRRYEVYEGQ
jgi:ABC-2 type transport system permease protein